MLSWRPTTRDPKSGLSFKQSVCGVYYLAACTYTVRTETLDIDEEVLSATYCTSAGEGCGLGIERFPRGDRIRREKAAQKLRAACDSHAEAMQQSATASAP